MGVIQVGLDGIEYEIVGGKSYKITQQKAPNPDPNHYAGGKCRPCNYAENSDDMHGAHCGKCECCSNPLNN